MVFYPSTSVLAMMFNSFVGNCKSGVTTNYRATKSRYDHVL
jgi:hypothetical protein